MQKVEHLLDKSSVSEQDVDDQLVIDSITLCVDIDSEITIIHDFIRDMYKSKFPELEKLVHHPVDYARIVKKIGDETDLTLVDFEGVLPSTMIMVVCVAASSTGGKPLQEDELQKAMDACDRALALDSVKTRVLAFLESRIGYVAPNLCAVVEHVAAAKLIAKAGGLSALANRHASSISAENMKLAGFAVEICLSTKSRKRVSRLVAGKSMVVACVDSEREYPTGEIGRTLRAEIDKKINKWLHPTRHSWHPKPLPVPDFERKKKKRGGKRARKTKEKYVVTEMRKLVNRMQFGVTEESSLGDGLERGYGMLGQAGNGKLRLPVGRNRLAANVSKKFKKTCYGSTRAISGLTSCLAFASVQGIELLNPRANELASGTQSTYFKETGTLLKIKWTI